MAREIKVVVLGGGQAGVGAAVALAKMRPKNLKVDITLVDPKTYFEIRWAAVRAWFDPRIREEMQTLYASLLPQHNITHVRDKVQAVNGTSVALESGHTLDFDVCLYAVGARCPTAGVDPAGPEGYTAEGRRAQLAEAGRSFVGQSALIVGGGTLGTEVAGELVGRAAHVTLVQRAAEVVPDLRKGGRRAVQRLLRSMGVEVYTDSRAVQGTGGAWAVQGKPAEETRELADVGVAAMCTGYAPRNDALCAGDLERPVNGAGWAATDAHFRVTGGGGRVFAFGDCCTTGDNNVTTLHSNYQVVAANMMATIRCIAAGGRPDDLDIRKLRTAKGAPVNVTVVTLGPNNGVADTPLGAFESVIPPFKNNTMFIAHAKSYLR